MGRYEAIGSNHVTADRTTRGSGSGHAPQHGLFSQEESLPVVDPLNAVGHGPRTSGRELDLDRVSFCRSDDCALGQGFALETTHIRRDRLDREWCIVWGIGRPE